MYRNNSFMVGLCLLILYIIIAIFSPWLVPYHPTAVTGVPLERPNAEHFLGTNTLGQDIFSELLYGTRGTLLMGVIGGFLSTCIGTLMGAISGYYGKSIDVIITKLIDFQMTIPMFPLLILLSLFFTPNIVGVSIIMGILGWTRCARIIRSQVLALVNYEFILMTKAIGGSDLYIIIKHIVPNILPLSIANFIFAVQGYMLMGVGLGFLGIGDPTNINWGQMINDAYTGGAFALGLWWWLIPPGLCTAIISVAISLLAYSLEEKIVPTLKNEKYSYKNY
ncbi:ABC transporter permease [Aceticella autotrophica]|uniref:ABC transporter permease n=2 Tax=Aceticella autotrophica TaxID=2755338 RepID=A0A975AXU1_9THEO|nr:ABC transporter permease [Aceticella autotrophica]QSZ28427.1 ABC transporter permease [Aceticella autotrophica]